jgi:anti-anti-sigma factor
MLSTSVERVGDTAVLHCSGQIVVGERLSALRDAVLCELDKHTIFLDLSRVDRIDAGGLGLLVFLHTSVNGLGTALKLLSPSAQVTEVLKLTKLDSVFTLYPADDTDSELLHSAGEPYEASAWPPPAPRTVA